MATGVSVRIDGTEIATSVVGYSVTEESTPVEVSDTTGAGGKITVPIFDGTLGAVDAKRMYRKSLRLADPEQGFTVGTVRLPSYSNGITSISADSRLVLLAARRLAAPFNGDVAGYAEYLLSLVGITSGFVIDPVFEGVPAVFPGWEGDVWLMAKSFAACYGGEWTLASGNIVFRPVRQRISVNRRDADVSWSVDDSNLARSVEGYWYNTSYETDFLAFPPGGWNEDTPVIQVDARQTVVVNYPLSGSLVSVEQPVAVDFVGRTDDTMSQYCVQGNDGLPVLADQWTDAGGRITVAISEDSRSLDVTVVGPDLDQYSPYRIAATAGPSDAYSSLRILGTGVFFDKYLISRPTSVPPEIATVEVGVTVDSPFITSASQLVDLLTWTASRYSSPRHTINVRTRGISRAGDTGSYAYPTLDDFNTYATEQGWTTLDDLNAAAPGLGWTTLDDFNAWWTATVSEDFANQAFGNVVGARVFRDGMWFRIRSSTIGMDITTYTAEGDTTIDDFNTYATEQGWTTLDDFNASWSGHTIDDFNLAPLTNPNGA